MVIQDEVDAPLEVSTMKTPHSDSKKYVIVQNHVRELPTSDHASPGHSSAQDDSSGSEKNAKKVKKSCKKETRVIENQVLDNVETNVFKHTSSKLEAIRRDLEELRKEFHDNFQRLGAKLDRIVQAIDSGPSTHRDNSSDSNSEEACHCRPNKKIIFDEDGEKSVKVPDSDNHVCPNKLKRKYSDVARNTDIHSLVMAQQSKDTRSLAVEYEEQNITLPEDLSSLSNILQDSKIAVSYRNKVINKVKLIKQGHMNDIKFSKPGIVEKLKTSTDSSDILEFKGANLFSLPGYPDGK